MNPDRASSSSAPSIEPSLLPGTALRSRRDIWRDRLLKLGPLIGLVFVVLLFNQVYNLKRHMGATA